MVYQKKTCITLALLVYLEECKYKVKKIHTPKFINIELGTISESDAETDSESNKITKN